MIDIYFAPYMEVYSELTNQGTLHWSYKGESNEYLGIAQQIFAQAMGWA